jgi:hypothetical protein
LKLSKATSAGEALVVGGQLRQLLDAGLAPRGPEVDDDHLPREVGEPQRPAVELLDLEGLHRSPNGLPAVHERGRRLGEPRERSEKTEKSDAGNRAQRGLPG